jgi:UDP-N-acetyl-D-mannosaminuronic acid dehydrogenase
MDKIKTVAVIGLGYIGLPTAAILATQGITVVGVDVDPARVAAVNRGEVPFAEPDVESYLVNAVKHRRLTASTTTPRADAYIVAVPTPFGADHQPDLRHIEKAAQGIAPQLSGGELVVLESTSPPGTTHTLRAMIMEMRPDLDQLAPEARIDFAHCPERVLPGRIMIELILNDRVVGGTTSRGTERASALYSTFCQGRIHATDAKTAETVKLVENSYRDVNIAFANEVAKVSESIGVDVDLVIELANRHPRVDILNPGPGVGGHCIAVDPWFLAAAAQSSTPLIRAARAVNDSMPEWVATQVRRAMSDVVEPRIALMGLSYKPESGDLRESPSLEVVDRVADIVDEQEVWVTDPYVAELPTGLSTHENLSLKTTEEVLDWANIVVILVGHSAYSDITSSATQEVLRFGRSAA